jgi:LEA14-like dessication related protein
LISHWQIVFSTLQFPTSQKTESLVSLRCAPPGYENDGLLSPRLAFCIVRDAIGFVLFFWRHCKAFVTGACKFLSMISMKNTSLFSLALLAVLLLASCSKPQRPRYLGYENVRLEKAGIRESIIAADLRFYNPNKYPLQLQKADMDVFMNDRFLGHSFVNVPMTVAANDTSSIPLRMQLSAKDFITHSARLLVEPDVRLKVKGSARVGKGKVFVNVPIDYEGNQRIELFRRDSTSGGNENQ